MTLHASLFTSYAPRFIDSANRVEHNLGEKITFFHMDCLASEVRLNFEKRSHNPILKEAGLERLTGPIPWCQNLRLRMIFP